MSAAHPESTTLSDEMLGRYVVSTEDGADYLLDLNGRILKDVTAGQQGAPDVAPASLVLLATCRVDEPMVALIDRHVPGVWFTRRTTARVTRITSARETRWQDVATTDAEGA